jgi:hypothetical protein
MCGDEDGGRLQHLSCPPPQRGRGCSFQLECDVMRRRGQEACGLAAARADGERFTRGVFDFVALQGLAGQPGPGQP